MHDLLIAKEELTKQITLLKSQVEVAISEAKLLQESTEQAEKTKLEISEAYQNL